MLATLLSISVVYSQQPTDTPTVLPRPDFHFQGTIGRTYLDLFRDVVRPNADTFYSTAFLNLATEPLVPGLERKLLDLSAEASDEGTNALMSDYIRAHEKLVWMYSAFVNKK